MIPILACVLLLAQGQAPASGNPDETAAAPLVRAGSSVSFQRAVLAVEERLAAGDIPGAQRQFKALPKLSFTLAWDEKAIPSNLRLSYAEARDRAVQGWMQRYPNCTIDVVPFGKSANPVPGLVITFVEEIPAKPEDPLPPAAASFFSLDPSEPRLEYVITLKRGAPSVAADYVDVHNEVAHAIAQYYGVEKTAGFGSYGSRTDVAANFRVVPSIQDLTQVKDNLSVCDQLARVILKKQRLTPSRPKLHLDPIEFDGGQSTQGELVKFNIQITNNGNAPLDIKAAPDCSCVSVMRAGQVGPGETRLFPAQIDLTDVVGELDKAIYIYANDLERNVVRVPVRIKAKPLFRLIAEGDGYVLMKSGGASARVFLILPEGTQMTPRAVRFEGLEAQVKYQPWSGELADPGLNEPSMPRKGYVFDVTIKDEAPVGQTIGNLFIDTDHPKYKRLQANLVIQSGIVSMPERVYYGEIPAAPRRSTFVLTRPGKNFKILSAEADIPNLGVSFEAQRENWEYRFVVQFDGKAPTGPLIATITIKTDDPSQPVIKVPVTAAIR